MKLVENVTALPVITSLDLDVDRVLADRPGYYDKAMQVLSEYRSAMNAIHDHHSPTHMGEPLLHNAGVER